MENIKPQLKASDLRVGNVVFVGNELFPTGWRELTIEDGGDIDNAPFYKPIPLTEEWLVKMGFIKELNAHKTHTLYIKEPLSLNQKEGYYSVALHYITVYPLLVELRYVHELQNLFFALTGTELTITQ